MQFEKRIAKLELKYELTEPNYFEQAERYFRSLAEEERQAWYSGELSACTNESDREAISRIFDILYQLEAMDE